MAPETSVLELKNYRGQRSQNFKLSEVRSGKRSEISKHLDTNRGPKAWNITSPETEGHRTASEETISETENVQTIRSSRKRHPEEHRAFRSPD
jgi:hypothetical protein